LQDDAIPLGDRLSHHAAATRALARQLGKQIHLTMKLGDVMVPSHVGELLNTALVHLCANAVDHGIEPPAERQARGKPPLGQIRIAAVEEEQSLSLRIEDDGRGIDFAAVKQRALAAGLISVDVEPTEAELTYLLFYPCFSLRDEVSGGSGRGLGLSAVKSIIAAGNGQIMLDADGGGGTTVTVRLPLAPRRLEVQLFEGAAPFCVPADYAVEATRQREGAVDPLHSLGVRAAQHVVADHVVRVSGPGFAARWLVPAAPRARTGERLCVGPAHPLEVVTVDGRDALLIRPHAV
jgi:two-component system chemotaxis sensor kinase CheA